jgi:hypothetical protein
VEWSLFLGGSTFDMFADRYDGYTARFGTTRSTGYNWQWKTYSNGWQGNGSTRVFNLGGSFARASGVLTVAGLGYDVYKYQNNQITAGELTTNTVVTGALLGVGAFVSAPVALVGGALYFGWQVVDPDSHRRFTDGVDSLLPESW